MHHPKPTNFLELGAQKNASKPTSKPGRTPANKPASYKYQAEQAKPSSQEV